MTKNETLKCSAVIHSASLAAAAVGAGFAHAPCCDSALITPIQLTMTISLGKVFGQKLSGAAAKSAMATGTATLVGRAVSQVAAGFIPVAGKIINAATAAAVTESLGWILAAEFEKEFRSLPGSLPDAPAPELIGQAQCSPGAA